MCNISVFFATLSIYYAIIPILKGRLMNSESVGTQAWLDEWIKILCIFASPGSPLKAVF